MRTQKENPGRQASIPEGNLTTVSLSTLAKGRCWPRSHSFGKSGARPGLPASGFFLQCQKKKKKVREKIKKQQQLTYDLQITCVRKHSSRAAPYGVKNESL